MIITIIMTISSSDTIAPTAMKIIVIEPPSVLAVVGITEVPI